MSYKIESIEGIGMTYGSKLREAGIGTTDRLLKMCCDPRGRKSTAAATGLSETLLLKWTNIADLMRISGVGSEYSELLEAAGVDTVKELRNRNAANLAAQMSEVNRMRKLTRAVPSQSVVSKWVQQAQVLPPVISY